jgi:hypothetical protein
MTLISKKLQKKVSKTYDKIYNGGDDSLDSLDTELDNGGLIDLYEKWLDDEEGITEAEGLILLNAFEQFLKG